MSVLSFDGVSISLGPRRVLSGVSFAVEPGQFVGVLGPNGAGKTTLFRAALGLVPIEAGMARVLGAPPRRGNPLIGYVPQMRRAPQANLAGAELLLGSLNGERWGWPRAAAADRAEVAQVLERVGAADLARRPVADLSGGERQRLFIAQALLGRPRLLLLDEPLISLDPARQRSVVELIRAVSRELGAAVLFSAHELNPLLGAIDRVLYLGNGSAAIGTVDEVVTEPVLSALYRTRVRVLRTEGRIFVMADDGSLEAHDHDHGDGDAGHHDHSGTAA